MHQQYLISEYLPILHGLSHSQQQELKFHL